MQIFLDPIKTPQIQLFDQNIRSFKDFINITDKHDIYFISIGYEVDTRTNSIDVLWYLKENNIQIPFINVHTQNRLVKGQIRKIVKKHFPETMITFITNV